MSVSGGGDGEDDGRGGNLRHQKHKMATFLTEGMILDDQCFAFLMHLL